MQGTIAQIITLVLHGNAFLQTGQLDPDFFPKNSAFTFCEYVRFVEPNKSGNREDEAILAKNPENWFKELKASGVYSLRLIYSSQNNQDISDRMSVGFIGGGGRWLIEALHPSGADYWEARWEVGNQDHPEKLIWQVAYGRIAQTSEPSQLSIRAAAVVKQELLSTLVEIEAFANKHQQYGFAKAFKLGQSALESKSPHADSYHKDISPSGFLNLESSQLLAASQAAWVFGGMGSWNDMGFSGKEQETYESLSDSLYRLLNEAFIVASNSAAPEPQKFHNVEKSWWQFWR